MFHRPVAELLEPRLLFARLAILGDLKNTSGFRDDAAMVKSWGPDLIISTGDNTHGDSSMDQTVGRYFHDYMSPYYGSFGAASTTGNRFYSAIGNHDYEDHPISDYWSFFTFPGNERYYTIRADATTDLFFINSNSQESSGTTSSSTQGQWLKNALSASTAKWKLVFFHFPAYTSGTEGNHSNMQWPFQQWGATAVFSGHDHMYERLSKGGFPYFVNGLAGAPIVPPQRVESGSQVRYSSDYGAMRVDSSDSGIQFRFYNRSGTLIDDYSIGAPTSPPPPPPPPPSGSPTTLITSRSSWKYLDNGSNQGSAWRALGFDDSAWKSGAAQLGYGDGDEATIVSYGSNSNNKFVTTYFRKSFNVADPSLVTSLNLQLMRDDGAVIYLNGNEIYRNNLPSGTISSTTLASSAVEDNTWFTASVSPSMLSSGNNVISVEMHQSDTASTDISFDLSLSGTSNAPATAPAAPSGLSASAAGTKRINLQWTDNSANETGFIIERSADGSTFDPLPNAIAANATTFTDTGLTPGTLYYYRVRARNSVGTSDPSNSASDTTAVPSLPAPPTNLAASAVSASQLNLSWLDNSADEDNFILERSLDGVNDWQVIATPAADASSYSDTPNLAAATTYYYRIRAVNSVGPSDNSEIASATTLQSTALPAPWVDNDIGSTGAAGSATYLNGVFSVSAAGFDIWGTADGFNFVNQPWNGDGQIIARINAPANNSAVAFAGVMFRETLAANAKEACVLVDASRTGFVRRATAGASSTAATATGTRPQWVKLIRSGSSFTAWKSSDSSNWTQVGSAVTIAMNSSIFIGLVGCSTVSGSVTTFPIDGVSVSNFTSFTQSGTLYMAEQPTTTSSLFSSAAIDNSSSRKDLLDILA